MDTEDLHGALSSNISRLVAFLTPVVAALVALILAWIQEKIGLDLQNHAAEIAGFVVSIILGACLTAAQWLRGRAAFERTAINVLGMLPDPPPDFEVELEDDDLGVEGDPPTGMPPGLANPPA